MPGRKNCWYFPGPTFKRNSSFSLPSIRTPWPSNSVPDSFVPATKAFLSAEVTEDLHRLLFFQNGRHTFKSTRFNEVGKKGKNLLLLVRKQQVSPRPSHGRMARWVCATPGGLGGLAVFAGVAADCLTQANVQAHGRHCRKIRQLVCHTLFRVAVFGKWSTHIKTPVMFPTPLPPTCFFHAGRTPFCF